MKYFFDTEFIENGETIDLVSIGIVSEIGRTYYAISKEFDPTKADSWVIENVLTLLVKDGKPIEPENWKSREQIKNDILAFVDDDPQFWAWYGAYDWVCLAQLFGKMVNLPAHFPMYARDIKLLAELKGNPPKPSQAGSKHNALEDARWNRMFYNMLIKMPYV